MLRTVAEPRGASILSKKEKTIVFKANMATANTFLILAECSKCHIPWTVENPNSSVMWHTPEWRRLSKKWGPIENKIVYCQFGMPYKKRTRCGAGVRVVLT